MEDGERRVKGKEDGGEEDGGRRMEGRRMEWRERWREGMEGRDGGEEGGRYKFQEAKSIMGSAPFINPPQSPPFPKRAPYPPVLVFART